MGLAPRTRPVRLSPKLAGVRARLNMTQSELADALSDSFISVTKQDISKFEKGEREPPIIVLLRYSKLTNIAMENFADDLLELPD